MSKVSTKPPSGMRDFLPEDLVRRHHVLGVVREVYERYGFQPLETPSIENLAILLGKYGEDEKLIYRLLHRGQSLTKVLEDEGREITEADLADQALRYDLTVPLARVVAQYGLPKYFKRYQIQPVWRADRPGKGRFREFFQCDVDYTGTESMVADAEVCAAGCEVLRKLGFDDFTLSINHRELLRGIIRAAGIDAALESTALVAVDKLDKVGQDGVLAELGQRGIDAGPGRRLLEILAMQADDDEGRLAGLRPLLADDERATKALDDLGELVSLLAVTPAAEHIRVAPDLARGLSYYTGPIFEARVNDLGSSIAGGGRYDELVGMFGKQRVPAVGLSLGLERILVVMAEREMYPALTLGAEVLLCWRGIEKTSALQVAHALRGQGIDVEVFPEPTKLGKQLTYADAPGVKTPFVAIVGESEVADGTVTLKQLATGEQRTVALADVRETITTLR